MLSLCRLCHALQHAGGRCPDFERRIARKYRSHIALSPRSGISRCLRQTGTVCHHGNSRLATYRTNDIVHSLDPSRPTTGVRYLENSSPLEDIYAYNDFSHDGIRPGCRKKKEVFKQNKPLLISEANGHMFPTKAFDSSLRRQQQALRHATVLGCAMKDQQHIGCIQWCMFDYATHQDFGSGDRICYHGVMDAFRNPKPASSVYAAQQ